MSENRQIVTEEGFIISLSESMDPIIEQLPDLVSRKSSADDADEEESWRYESVSEDDIARENGFWVDDDGHWRELDEEDDW